MEQIGQAVIFKRAIVFLLSVLTLVNCSNFNAENLVGEYYINNERSNDLIILKKDGTYIHRFIAFNAKIFESSGTWEFDSKYSEIVFDRFVFYDDYGSLNRPEGIWVSGVKVYRNGEIRLNRSRDQGIYYTNANNKE